MKKTYKAVLMSSLVILSLLALAVVSSGVAQAQECIARSKSVMARAEGITEAVGTIELVCEQPTGLGFGAPDVLEITVELNTRITSVINDDRLVQNLTYTGLEDEMDFARPADVEPLEAAAATLSEDGSTITWKIVSSTIDLGDDAMPGEGFQVTIGGIIANASAAGDEVTAVVSVGGSVAHSGALKLADVTTGLIVKVDLAEVLQCETDTESETAVVTIQEGEGFVNSITG